MKIIDEKGKFLRIINIVDICIVLFLLDIGTAVYVYIYMPPQINEHQEVMFQMYFRSMQYSQPLYYPVVLQLFSPGNEFVGGIIGDRAIIKTFEVIGSSGTINSSEVNFLITLQGNLSIAPHGPYLFDGHQIAPGKTLSIQIQDSYFTGDVLRVNYTYEKENKIIILQIQENDILLKDETLLFNSQGKEVGVILYHHNHKPDFIYTILIQSDVYDFLPFYNHITPLLPGEKLFFMTKDGVSFTGVIREVQ